MSVCYLQVTPTDPLVARDGRPFGAGQGNRMRSLTWPLPSVVAGSFRTALVKSNPEWDFTKRTPIGVMRCEVAGVFPCGQRGSDLELYLPGPRDAVAEPDNNGSDGKKIKMIHRLKPAKADGGCDLPSGLLPVLMPGNGEDFKPAKMPTWWPVSRLTDWLLGETITFDDSFLLDPVQENRDHVCINPESGAAMTGQIFTSTGLNLSMLSRFGCRSHDRFEKRFMHVSLHARVTIDQKHAQAVNNLRIFSPLGGERRLVHWKQCKGIIQGWTCPEAIHQALRNLQPNQGVRMVLATPAIFKNGWLPDWINRESLLGKPFGDGPTLQLVGAVVPRWKAVSGWALQGHQSREGETPSPVVPAQGPGPKAIRRMVLAGAVYFFKLCDGNPQILATNGWLRSVSDSPIDRRDGFGFAVWGTW